MPTLLQLNHFDNMSKYVDTSIPKSYTDICHQIKSTCPRNTLLVSPTRAFHPKTYTNRKTVV